MSTITQLDNLYRVMKEMIHSPWSPIDKRIMSVSDYVDNTAKDCGDNNVCPEVIQSHGGNVYEHSVWSAMQVKQWSEENDPLIYDVDIDTAMVSALLHDIGKGGDCIKYCDDHGVCWYDVYNTKRYLVGDTQKDDGYHPTFSGQILMGKRPFYLSCSTHRRDILDIPDLIASLGAQVDPREVALASYMHWEVGRLNIGKPEELTNRLRRWYDMFMISCARVGLVPTESLVRLCIVVAAADISAGTNIRLKGQNLPSQYKVGEVPANIYISSDPWTMFKMDKHIHSYQQQVIDFVNLKLGSIP